MASEAIVPILKQKEFGQDPIYNVGFLKRSLLAVSNDGGGLHLAALAGCPSVGLYGPSDPTKWGPLGERNIVIYKDMACSPCRFVNMQERIECELDRKCLKDISVDEVLEAVEFILGKRI
jgi:heptosyltransferase II